MRVEPYEKVWIALSLLMLLGFLGAISVSVFVHGISLPGVDRRIDPKTVVNEPQFATPGIRETGPGEYEVYLLSMVWSFVPNEIRVPAGARVTFHATSRDVTHGFAIHGANLNLMLIPGLVAGAAGDDLGPEDGVLVGQTQAMPGYVNRLRLHFDQPGRYDVLSLEYCGLAHQTMAGKIVVEEKS